MNLSVTDAAILAGLGYLVVFIGLIMLMLVVIAVGKSFAEKKRKAVIAAEPAPAPVAEEPAAPVAPGTAGQLKLYDTPPKTAAMLMAIVADKLGKPLNELRFISIKEVE